MKLIKKKSLGQHFLSDTSAVSRIVDTASIEKKSWVMEIGPGGGALTKKIHEAGPERLFLIEKDLRFYEELKKKYPDAEVMNLDACELDIRSFIKKENELIVVGNLPYNVSTVILENLIAQRELIPRMILMFQREVGERILAKVGTAEYGRLSLLVTEHYKAKRSFVLKPGSFNPPPKVDSMVVEFERLERPLVDIKDHSLYNRILMLVFSQRRKMLRRSLRSIFNDDQIKVMQEKSKISFDKRPQELNIKEFATLANIAESF